MGERRWRKNAKVQYSKTPGTSPRFQRQNLGISANSTLEIHHSSSSLVSLRASVELAKSSTRPSRTAPAQSTQVITLISPLFHAVPKQHPPKVHPANYSDSGSDHADYCADSALHA